MLIEYRVEVKNGAVTITQHIELAGATLVTPQQTPEEKKPQTEPGKVSVLDLPESFGVQKTPSAKDQSGGGPRYRWPWRRRTRSGFGNRFWAGGSVAFGRAWFRWGRP